MQTKLLMIFLFILFFSLSAAAQGTEFTYQGSLNNGGTPATGSYDFEFRLFDAVSGGSQVGSALGRNSVTVANGIFSVSLDFASVFPGGPRFLEIKVRQTSGGAFTPLTPRQAINSAPYSIKSETADNATNANTATNATQLGGIAANQYVQTGDARLSDARSPLPSSPNYIQNTNTAQNGNFNIIGSGTIGKLFATGSGYNGQGSVYAQTNDTNNALEGVNTGGGNGVSATSNTATGVYATSNTATGVYGISFGNTSGSVGVRGESVNGTGVFGVSTNDVGVSGFSSNSTGVGGSSNVAIGVIGQSTSGSGVYGHGLVQGSIALRTIGSSWFEGDTTPLNVSNTGVGTGIVIGSSGNIGYIQSFDYSVFAARILTLNQSGGNVGVGTTAPTQVLDVNGRARVRSIPLVASSGTVCFNAAGDLLQCGASSLKWKTNVQSYRGGLDIIRRLRPITFNWKEDGRRDIGLGAEEVAKVAPTFAYTNSKGEIEGVKYERLNILLINAVKEQQTEIETQQKQIDKQNAVNKNQQAEIDALKALVCSHRRTAALCRKTN